MEQLRRELQSLNSRMAKLSAGGGKKAKKGRNGGGGQGPSLPAASTTVTTVGPGKKARNRRRKPRGGVAEGTVRMRRSELVALVNSEAGKTSGGGYFDVYPDSFSFLKTLITSFEQVVWHRVAFYWRPAVGTTVGGLITYGYDYAFRAASSDRTKVAVLTPSMTHALYKDTSSTPLALAANKLQTRKFYTVVENADVVDKGPARFAYAFSGPGTATPLGEFWCEYDVTLSGTRA